MDDAVIYFGPIGFIPTGGFQLETLRSRHLKQSSLSNYQFGPEVGPLIFFAGFSQRFQIGVRSCTALPTSLTIVQLPDDRQSGGACI